MQVVLSLSPGGTERLVIDIVKRLHRSVRSIVCCLDEAGTWASELTAIGVPVHVLGRKPGFQPALGHAIADLARRNRVQALHCHHYTPFVYGTIASCLTRRLGVIFTEHGRLSDAGPSPKRARVNPLLGRLPSSICAVSADLKRHMVDEGFPERRIDVVYNGIDAGGRPTAAERAWARHSLDVADDALVVGTIGRLDPVKNLAALLEAHAVVLAQQPRARLVIVGGGAEERALRDRAAALHIDHAVRFVGYRPDARQLAAGFDLYANSSTHEGVSLTILEAMASLLPVVATRVGGNPEVVDDGETGVLVPARAVTPLAGAITALLADPQRRRAMGEAGRWRVKRHFTIEAMVTSYVRRYERCTPGRPSPFVPALLEAPPSCAESAAP